MLPSAQSLCQEDPVGECEKPHVSQGMDCYWEHCLQALTACCSLISRLLGKALVGRGGRKKARGEGWGADVQASRAEGWGAGSGENTVAAVLRNTGPEGSYRKCFS